MLIINKEVRQFCSIWGLTWTTVKLAFFYEFYARVSLSFSKLLVSYSSLRSLTQCSSSEGTARHLVVAPPRTAPAMVARPRRRIPDRLLPPPIPATSSFPLLFSPPLRQKNAREPVEFGYPRPLRCMGPPTSPKFFVRRISDPLRFPEA